MSAPQPPVRRAFQSDRFACEEHLCDHVLTRPESHDWALVLPGYRELVDPADDVALHRMALSLFTHYPLSEALELRDGYVAALLQAITDALQLGWWWEQGHGNDPEWCGLSLEGVFVVWNANIIKTGYLPRNSCLPPNRLVPPRIVNPLPRRDPTEQLGRPASDTPRHRYELFRSSHFSVSNFYDRAFDATGVCDAGSTVFVTEPPRIGKWQGRLARYRAWEGVT